MAAAAEPLGHITLKTVMERTTVPAVETEAHMEVVAAAALRVHRIQLKLKTSFMLVQAEMAAHTAVEAEVLALPEQTISHHTKLVMEVLVERVVPMEVPEELAAGVFVRTAMHTQQLQQAVPTRLAWIWNIQEPEPPVPEPRIIYMVAQVAADMVA